METDVKVSVNDVEIRRYAIEKLGLVEPGEMGEKKFETMLIQKLDDDPEEIMDYIKRTDFIGYANDKYELMSSDDFASDWNSYIDDGEVEDYARDSLNMLSEDDAKQWAEDHVNFD